MPLASRGTSSQSKSAEAIFALPLIGKPDIIYANVCKALAFLEPQYGLPENCRPVFPKTHTFKHQLAAHKVHFMTY